MRMWRVVDFLDGDVGGGDAFVIRCSKCSWQFTSSGVGAGTRSMKEMLRASGGVCRVRWRRRSRLRVRGGDFSRRSSRRGEEIEGGRALPGCKDNVAPSGIGLPARRGNRGGRAGKRDGRPFSSRRSYRNPRERRRRVAGDGMPGRRRNHVAGASQSGAARFFEDLTKH